MTTFANERMANSLPNTPLTWKNVHLTNVTMYNGDISAVYEGDWDFSHLENSILALLEANPSSGIFLYGCVERRDETNYPYLTAIIIPQGNVPTKMIYSEHTGKGKAYPFANVQYRWVQSDAQGFQGRVHYLVCDADRSSVPDEEHEDYKIHENVSLFTILPTDLEQSNGCLIINWIKYSFKDDAGTEQTASWDRRESTLEQHLDEVIAEFFDHAIDDGDSEDTIKEKTDRSDKILRYLKRKIDLAIGRRREGKKKVIDDFFEDVGYDGECLQKVQLVKICPVNFPAVPRAELTDKYYGKFGAPIVIIDHRGLGEHVVAQRLRVSLRNKCTDLEEVLDEGAASPVGTLAMVVLVDLLERTHYQDRIRLPNLFQEAMTLFGEDRILQQLGLPPTMDGLNRDRALAFVRSLFDQLSEVVEGLTRDPTSAVDFVMHFLFRPGDTSGLPDKDSGDARAVRLKPTDSKRLEISFVDSDTFLPSDAVHLKKFVSRPGIMNLLLDLVTHPEANYVAVVPTGARDDSNTLENGDDESDIKVDCFKQSLLLVPPQILSPEGKRRVKKVIPDHEITVSRANKLFKTKIKTITIGRVKQNIQETAMESKDVMIGMFHSGQRRHCVLIDGSDGVGTITDPDPSYGSKMRSKRSLDKLRIGEFTDLFKVKRVCLSDRKRKGCEKSLKLPFVKGSKL